jgi:hypothetical protein
MAQQQTAQHTPVEEAFTLRLDEDCEQPNGRVIATHAKREDAIAQARNIANSGYWFRVPVGYCTVFQGRREVAAFFHGAAIAKTEAA